MRQCLAWWGLGFIEAVGIAVVFVSTRRRPDVPVLPGFAIGTLISGLIGLFGARPGTILTSDPLMIGLMRFIVMPPSWGLPTLAPRHTSLTNVSLFMLLEMVLVPFWFWMGAGERPSAAIIGVTALALVTLSFHFLTSALEAGKTGSD